MLLWLSASKDHAKDRSDQRMTLCGTQFFEAHAMKWHIDRLRRRMFGESRAIMPDGALKPTRISRHVVDERKVAWAILNPGDEIQAAQMRDGYYEISELRDLKNYIKSAETILDLGANVGNHSVFFANFLNAKRIIPVEPFPPTVRHLLINLSLNYSSVFDLSMVGKAMGSKPSRMNFISPSKFNSGMTRLEPAKDGVIETIVGDMALSGQQIDLIKIDVEGMEVDALIGLRETISRCRPDVFVESTDQNEYAVSEIFKDLGYKVVFNRRMYPGCVNILFKS
jgi:FkbM family methyltransferase